ncbi:MAG: hypothetical protein KF746_28355 [Chitinophagaceae bacterium]|nr:hypothetical protein [Chitinophagaceae bacterium]
MQTMIKKAIVLAFSFFVFTLAWAQSGVADLEIEISRANFAAKTVVPPSPEAAELGKYGNTPVSLFTGTPQITIPLYELKGNNLSLPLTLSYNASGYMPSTVATWTGIGWSLTGIGVVARSVAGNPDNADNYFGGSPFTVPNSTDIFAYYDYKKLVKDGTKEVKPDNYYFNFNGGSGKFFVTPAQGIIKKEKDNLKIETCLTCTITYFNITDEQGNLYEFKETETTRMIMDDAAGTEPIYNVYIFPSAWYLSKITSADSKESMEFEYYATSGEEDMYSNFIQNTSVIYKKRTDALPTDPPTVGSHAANPPTVSIKRKYLKKISYKKNGALVSYVDLVSAAGLRQDVAFAEARLLQQVKVFSNLSSPARLVKQFDLTYGYFSKTTAPAAKHLRLDKVQEMPVDGSGLTKPGYEMEYNTTTIPNRTTAALDYWGFYNQAGNTSLVPTVTIESNTYGYNANREPSLNGSSCTLLKKIKYPTRGYTTFDYELNKDENNLSIGGVRIKEIVDYSFDSKKAVSKKYEYTLDNGNSSGKSNRHLLRFDKSSIFHNIATNPPIDQTYYLSIITVSANSIYGLGSIKGSHIGYSQVTEYSADVTTNEPLGKTVYNYETKPFSEIDDDIGNGDLKQKRDFDNTGKLVYELVNTYAYSIPETMPIYLIEPENQQSNWPRFCKKTVGGEVIYEQRPLGATMTDCQDIRFYPTLYDLRTDYMRAQYRQLTQQSEKKYDQASSSYQTNTKKLTYGNTAHTYPTIIEQGSSSDDMVVTTKKYADDYTISGSPDVIAGGIALLKNKNIKGAVIETQQFRKKNDGTNKRYIGGSLTTYQASLPVPDKIFTLDINQSVTTLPESAVTNGVFSYDNRYKEAGSFTYNATTGNLESQTKTSDVVTSYVWDYSNMYPIASVVNAAPSEIAYTSFESSGKGNWTFTGSTATAVSPDFTPTGNKHYALGSGSISKTVISGNVYIVSYWAYSNTAGFTITGGTSAWQKGATVSNWTYHEHKVTASGTTISITGTGTIDEVRLHPAGALMTTYSYDPLIGTTAINPPTQNIQYYEYDGFSRLLNIRDNARSIVKNHNYNYATVATAITDAPATMWYSQAAEQTLAKQGCAAGTYPTSVTYKVPYGKYVSSISQADANAKASGDLTANAQNYANANGQCYYKNVQKIKKVFKSNCTYEQGTGLLYTYTVPAGTYTSVISQADADAQAQADADANAQTAANTYGTCSCNTEDKKFINGVCETGVRQNMSTSQQPNGQWKCTYRYYFSNGTYKGPYYSYGSSPCGVSD